MRVSLERLQSVKAELPVPLRLLLPTPQWDSKLAAAVQGRSVQAPRVLQEPLPSDQDAPHSCRLAALAALAEGRLLVAVRAAEWGACLLVHSFPSI